MNILTIDLEDWFHILDHSETEHPHQWEKFESRVERNTIRILELLDSQKIKATWFCLGWIAEKYPSLIRTISETHHIGCHSMQHRLIYRQERNEFKNDLERSVGLLEDTTGKKINCYRAPGFSLGREHAYVFEELNRLGIQIDCSVFPAKRNHGGIRNFPESRPCILKGDSFSVKEFPMSLYDFYGKKIIFSGGGYFRLLPYSLIRRMMNRSSYVMTYFHPRDFDPAQPVIRTLPVKRRIMSYTGLRTSYGKFERLISDFKFIDLESADAGTDWNIAPVVKF